MDAHLRDPDLPAQAAKAAHRLYSPAPPSALAGQSAPVPETSMSAVAFAWQWSSPLNSTLSQQPTWTRVQTGGTHLSVRQIGAHFISSFFFFFFLVFAYIESAQFGFCCSKRGVEPWTAEGGVKANVIEKSY